MSEHQRIGFIDSTRGTAMILICLAHFANIYSNKDGISFNFIYYFVQIGVLLFMIISGIMLGYFYNSKAEKFSYVRKNYMNRGIFMLSVGHVILWSEHIRICGGVTEALKIQHITDAIGISIIIGPLLIPKLKATRRISISVILIIVSCLISVFWSPENWFFELMKESYFGNFGSSGSQILIFTFPLFPWFCLFFVSTCMGEKLGYLLNNGVPNSIKFYFRKIGAISIGVTVLVKAIFKVLKYFYVISPNNLTLNYILDPFKTNAPSITNFLFYGGLGLLLMSFISDFPENNWGNIYVKITSILGRNSLFVFFLQFFIYYTLLFSTHLKYPALWPLYFCLSVACIVLITKFWERMKWNRFLTIRLFRIAESA